MVTPLVYTTCDRAYFKAHGEAFRRSAEKHGHQVRIDVIEDDTDPDLAARFHERRVFYCYLRWLRLPEVLKEHPAVLVVDIDSVFNGRADIPDEYDMGLFFRPWLSHLALKVLCAASYWTDRAIPFTAFVQDKILNGGFIEWGNDQALIWQHYLKTRGEYRVLHLGDDFLNYHFDKEATIWTAKGPTRKSDPTYLERRAQYAA